MAKFITGDSTLGNSLNWINPAAKCVMCGRLYLIEELELRPVSENPGEPGTLQHVCTGCGGNYDTACQEAAADDQS